MSDPSADTTTPDDRHSSTVDYIRAHEPSPSGFSAPLAVPSPEPCAAYWLGRCLDAKREGAAKILVDDWPLLPPSSRALGATLAPTSSAAADLFFDRPDQIRLSVFETGAGVVPLVEVGARSDFLLLIGRLTRRGSVPVGDSMGSCFVGGIINRRRRAPFDVLSSEDLLPESDISALCHDRAILIWTGGGYAGLQGSEVGLDEGEWLSKSAHWRRVHEGCHHVVRRSIPSHRFGLRDEIVADLDGLWQSCGTPDHQLLSLALGLEEGASSAGRIAGYISSSGSDLTAQLVELVRTSIANLVTIYSTWSLVEWRRFRLREILALSSLDLLSLASPELPGKLDRARHLIMPPGDEEAPLLPQ